MVHSTPMTANKVKYIKRTIIGGRNVSLFSVDGKLWFSSQEDLQTFAEQRAEEMCQLKKSLKKYFRPERFHL